MNTKGELAGVFIAKFWCAQFFVFVLNLGVRNSGVCYSHPHYISRIDCPPKRREGQITKIGMERGGEKARWSHWSCNLQAQLILSCDYFCWGVKSCLLPYLNCNSFSGWKFLALTHSFPIYIFVFLGWLHNT